MRLQLVGGAMAIRGVEGGNLPSETYHLPWARVWVWGRRRGFCLVDGSRGAMGGALFFLTLLKSQGIPLLQLLNMPPLFPRDLLFLPRRVPLLRLRLGAASWGGALHPVAPHPHLLVGKPLDEGVLLHGSKVDQERSS